MSLGRLCSRSALRPFRLLLLPSALALSMSTSVFPLKSAQTTHVPGGLAVTEHTLTLPLDHSAPSGDTLEVFVREVVKASLLEEASKLPCLLYLQGGPGFPSPRLTSPPSGWLKAALDKYRILLLDQRGTGRSTAATAESIVARGDSDAQAEYLSHFRADSIIQDCEAVREAIGGGKKLTLLGQSYGGFCILSYLSSHPEAIERSLFTCGLAPVTESAQSVYKATFARMEARAKRFYTRYPDDGHLIREIVRSLEPELGGKPVPLPRGGTLTARRFLQLGLLLGSGSGLEALHNLLELCREPSGNLPVSPLPQTFLLAVESAQEGFETNPIYWLLHESIYCDGQGASNWAAQSVQKTLPQFDHVARLRESDTNLLLTGEMVYSWMGEDYAWLRPLSAAAHKLAQKRDWTPLYDRQALEAGTAPCAALVSYDDIYVERAFSEKTASVLGARCKLWVTNEFQHSGLRDDPSIFGRLDQMAKGEIEY